MLQSVACGLDEARDTGHAQALVWHMACMQRPWEKSHVCVVHTEVQGCVLDSNTRIQQRFWWHVATIMKIWSNLLNLVRNNYVSKLFYEISCLHGTTPDGAMHNSMGQPASEPCFETSHRHQRSQALKHVAAVKRSMHWSMETPPREPCFVSW
jgi:hypothetical protein